MFCKLNTTLKSSRYQRKKERKKEISEDTEIKHLTLVITSHYKSKESVCVCVCVCVCVSVPQMSLQIGIRLT